MTHAGFSVEFFRIEKVAGVLLLKINLFNLIGIKLHVVVPFHLSVANLQLASFYIDKRSAIVARASIPMGQGARPLQYLDRGVTITTVVTVPQYLMSTQCN